MEISPFLLYFSFILPLFLFDLSQTKTLKNHQPLFSDCYHFELTCQYILFKHLDLFLHWFWWFTFWLYFTILNWRVVETLPANWLVWLRSSHQLDLLWLHCSLCKSRRLWTVYANGCQFVHFFRQRHQIDYVSKWLPLKCAVKSSHNDNDSLICKFLSHINNILKELTFINSDNIVFEQFLFDIVELRCLECFVSDSKVKVRNYWSWVAITS